MYFLHVVQPLRRGRSVRGIEVGGGGGGGCYRARTQEVNVDVDSHMGRCPLAIYMEHEILGSPSHTKLLYLFRRQSVPLHLRSYHRYTHRTPRLSDQIWPQVLTQHLPCICVAADNVDGGERCPWPDGRHSTGRKKAVASSVGDGKGVLSGR